MRMFRGMAWTCMLLRFRFGRVRAVFLERARQRKFAETMADHVFGDEHRVENFSVVNIEGEPDEIRRDHRTPRPRLDRRFLIRAPGLLDFLHQVTIDERTFFNRATHSSEIMIYDLRLM